MKLTKKQLEKMVRDQEVEIAGLKAQLGLLMKLVPTPAVVPLPQLPSVMPAPIVPFAPYDPFDPWKVTCIEPSFDTRPLGHQVMCAGAIPYGGQSFILNGPGNVS